MNRISAISLSLVLTFILSAHAASVLFSQGYAPFNGPYLNTVVGVQSFTFAASLSEYDGTITVTPSSASGAVTFTPGSFTLTSASSIIPFSYVSTQTGQDTITWAITGSGSASYTPIPDTTIFVNPRSVLTADAFNTINNAQLAVGVTYGPYSISVDYAPPSGTTVTVSPSSTGATFSGALTFSSTTTTAQFSFTPTQTGPITISWVISGSTWYANILDLNLFIGYRTFTVVGPSTANYVAGQKSGVYTVSTQYPPASDVSLAISLSNTACPGVTPVASTAFVAFSPTVYSATFTVTSPAVCSSVVPTFTLAGTNQGQYTAPVAAPAVSFGKLSLSVTSLDPVYSIGGNLYCGNSAILSLTASAAAPTTGFSVVLSSPAATFSPSTLTFSSTVLTNTFTVTSTGADKTISIDYKVTGADSSSVNLVPSTSIPLALKTINTVRTDQFVTPSFASLLAGTTSGPIHVTLNTPPSSALVITPQAPGLTFSPSSLTFSPTITDLSYTITGAASGSYTVIYTTSGADSGCYAGVGNSLVTVSLLNIQVAPSGLQTNVGALSNAYTVTIPGLSAAVTLTPQSLDANNNPQSAVTITPSTLSLTPANPTATFQLKATSVPAVRQISFTVSGAGASQVSTTARYFYTVNLNTFTLPTSLATSPRLFAGTVSQPLIVTLSGTVTSVNLIPTAPSTKFTPSVLTFTPTSLSQSFTITPLDASTAAGGDSRTITWTVNGTDASLVATPSTQGYTAVLRPFVVDSSAYLSGSTFIGTPVPFTVSTLYAPESPLTITPTGSFTFTPASITISADSPAASFTATPTLAGQNSIVFTVTGASASYYAAIPSLQLSTQQATINVFPPTATALYVGVPSGPAFVRLSAPPSDVLIVNVYSQQVAISPSTLTFSPTDTYATFTYTSLPNAFTAATGSFQTIYLEYAVSGTSASQYQTLAPTTINVIPTARRLVVSPTTLTAQIGVPVSFSIYTPIPPTDSLTLTPYVPQVNQYYQISPESVTLSNGTTSAYFTVTAITYPVVAAQTIVLSLSGPDANLYAAAVSVVIAVNTAFGTFTPSIAATLPFGKPYSTYITLSQTASESISLEPYVLFGQPITFSPPVIQFTAGMTWAPLIITPQAPGFSRIAYTIAGDSAGIFVGSAAAVTNDITITQGTITTVLRTNTLSFAMTGSTNPVTFSLSPATVNGFNLSISGTGLSFSPSVITFAPGSSYATTTATALQNRLGDFAITTLDGPDAANYVNPCPTQGYCFTSSGSASVFASASGSGSLQSTITFSLSTFAPATSNIIITPLLPGVVFQPATVALGGSITSASTVAYSSVAGTQLLAFNVSGPGASYFTYPDQSTVAVTFAASPITVTVPSAVYAGITSSPITLTVLTPALSAVPAVTITPVTTTPGVVFSPASVTIDSTQNELSASFTYTYSGLGTFSISYFLSGPGASAYSIASSTVTNSLGAVEIPPSFPANYLLATPTTNFIYGIQSLPFTVFIRGVAGNLTVQPISDNFNFTPTQLVFSPSISQVTFTMLPTKVGLAVISFNLLGQSASLYARPAPITTARVVYRINVPKFPNQTPGVLSVPQYLSISPPTNTSFVVDLAASNIVFNPSRLVFGAGVSSVAYTILPLSVSVPRAVGQSVTGGATNIAGAVATMSIVGRSADDNIAINYPLVAPVAIPVVPGYFFIQHPRYQMGVPAKIHITLSNTPRSDVTISLVGNNMQFEPPYAVFQNGGPNAVDIKVTPLHASSYEVNYAPFKIDYQVSGTNVGDYANPTETYHYVALSQGYIAAIILMSLLAAIILIAMCLFFANKVPGSGPSRQRVAVNSP